MFTQNSDITLELQEMIDRLSAAGGGEIVIPPGEYHTRPLELKSGICLVLQAGTRLVASPRREDYYPVGFNHNEMGDVYSAFFAMGQSDISIRGQGTIDLNGMSFYHMDIPTEVHSTGPAVSSEYLAEAPRTWDWRVCQPMFFHRCRGILVEGIRIVNAPCWTMSFDDCQTVKMINLTIDNSLVIPNNDGMHFTGSRDIVISGCHICAGDDCVALSSITDWNRPCEHVVITNCVFQSASKAISVGYMHSIVRNVVISNVVVKKSNRAFVSMANPGTGLVEQVQVSNCIFEGRSYGGNWWGNGEAIVLMATPHNSSSYRDPMPPRRFEQSIRNVSFCQVSCLSERPIAVVGSEAVIQNVRFVDVVVQVVPEERPSLKGNVIDLAPGPENFSIPRKGIGIVCRHARILTERVTDQSGGPVEILELDA